MGWRDGAGEIEVDGRGHGDTPGMVCPFSHSVSAHSFTSQHVKKHTTPSRLPELVFGLKLGALTRFSARSRKTLPQMITSRISVSSQAVDSDWHDLSLAREQGRTV